MPVAENTGHRRLAAMQPYLFPYIGYFQLISAVDKFILYDRVNYKKGGWVNRNRILEIKKQPIYFRVPVKDASPYRKLYEIRIDRESLWRDTIRKLLHRNYRKAPFFDEVFALIEGVLAHDVDYLTELNSISVRAVADYLEIPTEIVSNTTEYEPIEQEMADSNSATRAFYSREQGLDDRKTVRIICLCKYEKADTYINAIGGRSLYDKDIFAENGIELQFVSTLEHSYRQDSRGFFPNLSIVDVMMNCGKKGTKALLDRYELI